GMDPGAERLDSHAVSAGLCARVEPGGIPMGLLEAARATERLPPGLVGTRQPSAASAEAHPPSPSHYRGLLGAIKTAALADLYYAKVNSSARTSAALWQRMSRM